MIIFPNIWAVDFVPIQCNTEFCQTFLPLIEFSAIYSAPYNPDLRSKKTLHLARKNRTFLPDYCLDTNRIDEENDEKRGSKKVG